MYIYNQMASVDGEDEKKCNKNNKPRGVEICTITSLSEREQVDCLAQALLREFMHRRGYTKTLQTFDKECPRNKHTISSRQLMRQLLEIPSNAFPSRLSNSNCTNMKSLSSAVKSSISAGLTEGVNDAGSCFEDCDDNNNKSGGNINNKDNGKKGKEVWCEKKIRKQAKKKVQPTYMEELCSYRLQKREVQKRKQEGGCVKTFDFAKANEAETASGEMIEAMIVDPSDAEMERWRSAAEETEQRIAKANERHEGLLHELHERKMRKKEKLKKKHEKELKKKIDVGEKDSCYRRHHHHHHHHRNKENIHSDNSNSDLTSTANSGGGCCDGRRVWFDNSGFDNDDKENNDDEMSNLSSFAFKEKSDGTRFKGSRSGSFAEPEFLFGALEKQKKKCSTGTAVGSRWTPCGGDVTQLFVSDRRSSLDTHDLMTTSLTGNLCDSTSKSECIKNGKNNKIDTNNNNKNNSNNNNTNSGSDDNSGGGTVERAPSFFLGEDMSLMSARMQAAKKQGQLGDWFLHPSSSLSSLSSLSPVTSLSATNEAARGVADPAEHNNGRTSIFVPLTWQKHVSHTPAQVASQLFGGCGVRQHAVLSRSSKNELAAADHTFSSPLMTASVPQPTGILKTSAESRHKYDWTARPAGSAMRQQRPSSSGAGGGGGNNSNGKVADGNDCGVAAGDGGEISLKRKNRKVTILVD